MCTAHWLIGLSNDVIFFLWCQVYAWPEVQCITGVLNMVLMPQLETIHVGVPNTSSSLHAYMYFFISLGINAQNKCPWSVHLPLSICPSLHLSLFHFVCFWTRFWTLLLTQVHTSKNLVFLKDTSLFFSLGHKHRKKRVHFFVHNALVKGYQELAHTDSFVPYFWVHLRINGEHAPFPQLYNVKYINTCTWSKCRPWYKV